MANNQNTTSTILSEHRRIVGTRYVLAIFNFIAVLLGMLVTLFFVSRRGIYDAVLTVIWVLIVINAIQIALCLGEFILRSGFGINLKFLPAVSYVVGFLWVLALVLEMVLATIEAGTLRTDLLIVAIIQAVVAIVAYILWPNLDRRAIDSMIKPSSRGDEKKRAKKAKRYVATYGFLTVLIVLAQAATLLLYKMPPTFYDIFADNRALAYELNEDKDGYIVSAVYNGTSPYVNIPATYNNLPVVGIKSGALVDDGIIEKYKITSITFGTPEKDENGNEVLKSNLQFINSGAIACSRVESLSIPESVTAIEDGAIRGDAIRTIEYSSRANFDYAIIAGCPNLARVLMSGEHVGVIASLEGMPERVNIQVDKDIYNAYRESNLNYVSSFSPILADDEFCIDFFTGCDYYIDSIFAKKGETVKLTYASLKNDKVTGVAPSVDTLAYIRDAHELGTDGAKADSAFRGWYYDGNYVAKVDFTEFGEISLTESTKIYAKWVNEYNATLNWGTYKPAGQVDKVYWTSEDLRSFPVVTDRNGYSRGVVWTKAGTDQKLTNSDGITESIALNATWQFDAPTISLDYILNGGTETITVGGATFTYDEYKTLQLSAVHSHALEADQINNTVDYDYEWYKDGVKIDEFSNTDIVRLQNVVESGVYTLRVTATPHHYADQGTYAEVNYNVQIAKKSLDLGDVTFNYLSADKHFTYNGGMQSCVITGNVATPGVGVTYTYTNDSGYSSASGMVNAGNYEVVATFAKVDPLEAANYATDTLTTQATVNPIVLATPTWSNGSFVYDKSEHAVYISFAEAIAGEDVGVVYEGATATDAGSYTAIVKDITNTNYTRVGVNSNLLSCDWQIAKRPVTVQSWKLNGSATTSVTYTGAEHSVEAVISGVMQGDTHVRFSYEGSTMAATNVGTYVAEVTGVNDSNYTFDDTAEFEWAITPARLTVTFDSHGNPTYNGGAQGIYATVSGIVAADVGAFDADDFDTEGTTASVSLAAGENANSLKLAFSATNAATYEAKINGLLSGGQHLANYVIDTAAEDSFSITPKQLTVVRPLDRTYAYNGESQRLDVYVEGFVNDADKQSARAQIAIAEGNNFAIESGNFIVYCYGKDADDYDVSILAIAEGSSNAIDNPNYTLNATVTTISIAKKVVTIASWTMFDKAENRLVNWSANGYTYNKAGYRIGYTLAGAVDGENVTLALTNADQVDASNSYYVTNATLADDAGDDDVNKNYVFAGDSAQWKINPRQITLTWKVDDTGNTSFVYSKVKHTAAYTIGNIIEGDSIDPEYENIANLEATDVGNYSIRVTDINNDNYVLAGGDRFDWSITPKAVKLIWELNGETNKTSLVYDGSFREVEVYVDSLDVMSGDVVSVNVSGSTTAAYASGYTATADSLSNGNYVISSETTKVFNWTISPLTIEVIWDGQLEFVYNSQNQHPTATVTNLCGTDSINLTYTNYGKNAGTYKVRIDTLDNGNYTFSGAVGIEQDYTIIPKVVYPNWNDNTANPAFVYNAETKYQHASVMTGATTADDGKMYAVDSIEFIYENDAKIDAGSYTARVVGISGQSKDNYVLGEGPEAYQKYNYDWAVRPRPVTLYWAYTSTVYNSETQYPTAAVSNTYGQTVNVTSYTGAGISAETKGSYVVTANGLDNANFTLVDGERVSHSYSIAPRTLQYEWYGVRTDSPNVARDINNLVYDGYQTSVLVRFMNLCEGDAVEAVYAHNVLLNADSVGKTVTVTLDGAHKDNYTFPEAGITKNVKVAPQPVKITWEGVDTVVYDSAQHELVPTVTANVAGNGSYSVPFTVTVNYGEHVKARDVGEYNYLVALTDTNFTLANCEGPNLRRLTITPAEITVTWSNLTHVYDGNQKTAIAVSTTAGVAVNLSGESRTAAGRQIVRATSADANYKVTNDSAELVIETAKLQATWNNLADVVYDGFIHKPTVSLTNVSNTSILPSCTVWYNDSTVIEPMNAGTYSVVFTLSDSVNFELVDPTVTAKSFTIAPKTVNILEWSDDEFYYDGTLKTLTAVLDDALAQGTVTYSGNSLINAGDTIATVYVGSNYKFADGTVTTHTLKINPAIVRVEWHEQPSTVIYDRMSHSLTADLISNTGINVGRSYTYNGNAANNVKNAGRYTVSVALTDTANFVFASDAVTYRVLTIEKKELSVNWKDMSDMVYSLTTTYGFAPTMVGSISPDSVSFVYDGVTSANSAGTYNVKIIGLSGSDSANYKLTGIDLEKTYVIRPQTVKITWSDLERVYNGNYQRPTVSVVDAGDGRAVAFNLTEDKKDAGNYEFTVSLTTGNYTLEGCQGNVTERMTITPKPVTITWPTNTTVVYDGANHCLVPTVNGVSGAINPDKITVVGAGRNAGVYNFTVTAIADPNYTLAGVLNTNASLTISKRQVNISWNNLTQTYGMMSENIVFATLENAVYGEDVYPVVDGFSATLSAGYHDLTVNALAGSAMANYQLADTANTTVSLLVNKQKATAIWSDMSFVYNGKYHAPTLTVTSMTGEDLSRFVSIVSGEVNAGEYTYFADDYFQTNPNWELVENTSCTMEIKRMQITSSDVTVTYDKDTFSFSVSFNALPDSDADGVTIADDKLEIRNGSGFKLQNGTIDTAGTYMIKYNASDIIASDNYEIVQGSTASKVFVITNDQLN